MYKQYDDTQHINTLYNSLTLLHLNYCLLLWGYHLETIFNFEKKTLRAITSSHYKAIEILCLSHFNS